MIFCTGESPLASAKAAATLPNQGASNITQQNTITQVQPALDVQSPNIIEMF